MLLWGKTFNKKNVKYIILATFETLNIGLGYSILPYLLTDSNIVLINIFREYDYNSMFGNIIKQVKNLKNNSLSYKEKKVVERKKTEKKEKDEENVEIKNDNIKNNIDLSENINDNKVKNNIINNSSYKMVIEKEKLFNLPLNNNGYLSFNLESKYKYTDYGMELSNEEIEIMKKNNESENTTYNSNFLNFKRELENKDKKEMNLELTEFCIPTKIETKESKLEIKCDFLFYPMINNIDFMSKKLIIEEIKPKDGIILIGYSNVLSDKLKLNNMKCYVLTNNENDKYEQKLINNIIPFNFTSEDLHSGQKIIIEKGNENIYSFDSLLLSVKTKREQLIDVSIVSNKYKKIEENKKDKIKVVNEESQNDKIFSQNNLKLINIKHHIENNSNIKLLINEQKLKTLDKSVEVYIKDGELVIEGEFNEQYFNIKSKINNFYLNNIEK